MKKTIKITTALFILLFSILGMTSDAKAALLSVDNAKAVQYYSMVPANVRARLEANGTNILVDTATMKLYAYKPTLLGITVTDYYETGEVVQENVYIRNGEEKAILHEVGHVVDNYNRIINYWSTSPTWNAIYASEVCNASKAGMERVNYSKGPMEYFAEAFQSYILDPVSLATYCPSTYQFIAAATAMY